MAKLLQEEIRQAAGEVRHEGDTWFFPSKTDKHEVEHQVDIHCSCAGFSRWRYCQHIVRAIELAKAARGE